VVVVGGGVELSGVAVEPQRYVDLQALEDAVGRGVESPRLVLFSVSSLALGIDTEQAEAIHTFAERTLLLLKAFLASESLAEARLVLLTDRALPVFEQEVPNLAQAALVGLLRSAHSEHPDRFALIDIDHSRASAEALYGVLASEEPELALRDGLLYAPRLGRVKLEEGPRAPELDPDGTILLTGGTGGLGALLARHLVVEHQARHLVLVSRSGDRAEGVSELRGSLQELGCDVQIVACDVSDRDALRELIAGIPPEHPLTSVVHAAAVLEEGDIESLDGERLRRGMASKVDAAINLHELTAELGLSELILFSSFAGIMGSPRRASYAAANTFLDALAHYRRAQGLPARSLAFGLWESVAFDLWETGMSGEFSEAERARIMERLRRAEGLLPLSDEQGLELIDIARGTERAMLVPARLDSGALRSLAKAGMLPQVLHGLVRQSARRSADAGSSLARKLAEAPESEWQAIVLELVKSHVAGVLGHDSTDAIDPKRPFKEAGFDSLAAVDLRNRLGQATGLRLPATLVFDHPTPAAVAEFLRTRVDVGGEKRSGIDKELKRLEAMLLSIWRNDETRKQAIPHLRLFSIRLQSLLTGGSDAESTSDGRSADDDLNSASDDELFEIIEREFGSS
jgi:NAD(P)-dependent dehydrogenase (short-subunit alcohol dehydrogenase family)/acyl carrier protein